MHSRPTGRTEGANDPTGRVARIPLGRASGEDRSALDEALPDAEGDEARLPPGRVVSRGGDREGRIGHLPLHLAGKPGRGDHERIRRSGPRERRSLRGETDDGGDRDPLQEARGHRRLRSRTRHDGSGPLHRDRADARADLRGDQPEGPPRSGRAVHLRSSLREASDSGLSREPLQHGGRRGRGPPERARSRGEGDRRRARGPERRRDGRHRLRASSAAARREAGESPRLRRARAPASRAGPISTTTSTSSPGRGSRGACPTEWAARTSSSAPPRAVS